LPVERPRPRTLTPPPVRAGRQPVREPIPAQIASFVDLFIRLLVLKSFLLPLFIIPTGSMAETLAGAHVTHTCSNCGFEYQMGVRDDRTPLALQCPNCRWRGDSSVGLVPKAGDRIVVHGWPYDFDGALGPQRWDVVVFKNPDDPQVNFIKRLIGLPGEMIEIIDGDVFVGGDGPPRVARKTRQAQTSLWFPFFRQDYLPRSRRDYDPRWAARQPDGGWLGLGTRVLRFDGLSRESEEIVFLNSAGDAGAKIEDVYGYDGEKNGIDVNPAGYSIVTDVRLGCDISFLEGQGFVELSVSKYADRFFARLARDGTLVVERARGGDAPRERWGEVRVDLPAGPLRFALGHADYRVAVELDDRVVWESNAELYDVAADEARRRSIITEKEAAQSRTPGKTVLQIAAGRCRAALSHVRIDRDVHYTRAMRDLERVDPRLGPRPGREYAGRHSDGSILDGLPGNGVRGNPIRLSSDQYFMLGDNSPQSRDGRAWTKETLGPHLRPHLERGEYQVGTVPRDQLIGRAFLVYWPGFMPLTSWGPNLLPDLGRVRWIH
jgi:signal peptidase I